MEYPTIIKVIAAMFGASALGSTVLIFAMYIKSHGLTRMGLHILTIAISYILIVFATIISVFREVYPLQSIWFALVSVSYFLGTIALFVMADRQFKAIRKEIHLNITNKTEQSKPC